MSSSSDEIGKQINEVVDVIVDHFENPDLRGPFSQTHGLLRAGICKNFTNVKNHLTGEQIYKQVKKRLSRALDKNEDEELQRIGNAWDEWVFIWNFEG